MKVLFLDIDGVLNKASDYEVIVGGNYSLLRVNQCLTERLKKVLNNTGAKVVLSSSWRLLKGGREFVEECGIPVMDVTDNGPGKRGDMIKRWLDSHDVVTYAIVDDDSDMLVEQLPHFVLTEFVTGLTEQAAYRLTYKLGGKV